MRGMPFHLQGKERVLQVLEARGGGREEGSFWDSLAYISCKKRKGFEGLEPRSVLDTRRSPSPPTPSSTLSSSLGGASSDTTTAGVAAVSDNTTHHLPAHKWPPSSTTTTPSSSSAVAAPTEEQWASELHPIPAAQDMGADKCGMGVDDWEAMLSAAPAASPTQEQTFLQWIMTDGDDPSAAGMKQHHNHILSHHPLLDFDGNGGAGDLGFGHFVDPGFGFDPMGSGASSEVASGGGFPPISSIKVPSFGIPPSSSMFSLPPGVLYQQESMDDKQLLFGSGLVLNQHHQQVHPPPNPSFFLPLPPFATQRHHTAIVEPTCKIPPKSPFADTSGSPDLFLRRNQPQQQAFDQMNAADSYHVQHRPMKPNAAGDEVAAAASATQKQQQALVDQLFKAAELIEASNPVSAHGILARLNHQLPSPAGKPLLRSAFYFKEALQLIANSPTPSPSPSHQRPPATPLEVVLKLGTYKAFSEVSPVLQFTHFTCIQAILEELSCSDCIHIVDFDIGVGGQWSSFMQELAQRRCSSTAVGGNTPLLKITAFASPYSHHPLELHLTRENLSHFASDLNIPFEFNVLSLDNFDPSLLLSMCCGVEEAIAVNLPVTYAYHPPVPALLRLVKQLSPKIVVSVDHGFSRNDLPFSHHFLHAFQSSTVLLDSMDAAGANPDVSNKIERFLLQPRIESALLGRHSAAADKMLPWRTLFASSGFIPLQFSNFTETQAECLLKRVQVRGFHVEKRQGSLFLCWQRGELVSVSAWRC